MIAMSMVVAVVVVGTMALMELTAMSLRMMVVAMTTRWMKAR